MTDIPYSSIDEVSLPCDHIASYRFLGIFQAWVCTEKYWIATACYERLAMTNSLFFYIAQYLKNTPLHNIS